MNKNFKTKLSHLFSVSLFIFSTTFLLINCLHAQSMQEPLINKDNNRTLNNQQEKVIKLLSVSEKYKAHPEYGKTKLTNPAMQSSYELIQERTADSRLFQNLDGSFTAVKSGEPMHYKDADGWWRTIDASFEKDAINSNLFHLNKQRLPISFDGSTGIISMKLDASNSISYGNDLSLIQIDKNGNVISKKNTRNFEAAVDLNKAKAGISNIFDGIDASFNFDSWMAKTNYIISTPALIDNNAKWVVFREKINIPINWTFDYDKDNGTFKDGNWQGDIVIKNTNGETMSKFLTPVYFDSGPDRNTNNITGSYKIEKIDNSTYYMYLMLPASWLLSPDRVYPLTIDPVAINDDPTAIASCLSPTYQASNLSVGIPIGNLICNTYLLWEFTALNGSWMEDQESYVSSINGPTSIFYGYGAYSGTKTYALNSTIGNGTSTGSVNYTFYSSRNWGGSTCNTTYNYLNRRRVEVTYGSGSPSILLSEPSLLSYCKGDNIHVSYMAGCNFVNGNLFILQLSDASGGFSNPINLDTITSIISDSFNSAIPSNVIAGTAYHLRVISTNPVVVSNVTTNNISISEIPQTSVKPTGDTLLCANPLNSTYTTHAVPNAVSYNWVLHPSNAGVISATDTTAILDWNNSFSGIAYLMVSASNGTCNSLFSDSLKVTINPTPTVNQITNIAVCHGSIINVGNFVSSPPGASFTWTNTNTNIGLTVSGTGNIASWMSPANSSGCTNTVGTITVTPTLNGCIGTPVIFTVTIYPTPTITQMSNIYVCPGSTTNLGNFTSCPSGASYSWTNSNTAIGLMAGGTGNINAWTAPANNTCTNIVSTITVTPTLNGCSGPPMSFIVTIYPTPTVNQITNIVVCPGSTISIPNFTSCPVGATSIWTNSNTNIGLAASGTGNILSWTAPLNITGVNLTGSIIVRPTLNGCEGPPMSFTITVYASPIVNSKANILVCPGATINIGNFASVPAGASFSWTNSNTAIGLGASGIGNIVSWTAPANSSGCTNTVGTITVTLILNGCTGTPMSFTVTINPTPTVNQKTNIYACPGTQINPGNFVSCPAGASYSWTNSNTNIGIAAIGSGNVPSWTAPANNTCTNITGTITVTPILNGCTGLPMSFTVTIYPKPTVTQISNIYACPGSTISIPYFTSCLGYTTFTWTNSNTNIGLVAGGSGNIPSWTAFVNNTCANITGTITVTPTSSNGCFGTSMSFTVTIFPTPVVNQIANIYACPGSTISIPNLTSCPSGASFSWTNTNTAIGLPSSGGSLFSWTAPPNNTGANIVSTISIVPSLNGCVGTPMNFTVTIYSTPVAPVANDVTACFGALIPDLEATGSGTIHWYDNPSLIPLLYTGNPFATGHTAVGVYTYYVTQSINNCESYPVQVTLTILSGPATPVSGGNQQVCCGNPVPDLTATGTDTIKWYSDAGLTTLVHIGSTLSTGQIADGVYTYYATQTNSSNCVSASVAVTLTITDTPTAPTANNVDICFGETVPNLTATGTLIKWYSDVSLTNLVFTGNSFPTGQLATGTYTYYATQTEYSYESPATTVTLTIHAIPAAPVANNVTVCSSTPVPNLEATGSGTIRWYANCNLISPIYTGSSFNPMIIVVGTYTFCVTQTINGCESPATQVTLTILPIPAIPAKPTGDSLLCINALNTTYTTLSVAGATSYTWKISPTNAGIIITNDTTATINWDNSFIGTAHIRVAASDGLCTSFFSDSFEINITSLPIQPIISVNGLLLSSSYAIGNQWYYEGVSIPNAIADEYTATQNGYYYVVYTDSAGCSSISDSVQILTVNTEFSVNEDGIKIYPNPTSGLFFIDTSLKPIDKITVQDILGREIFKTVSMRPLTTIDLRKESTGIYVVKFFYNSSITTRKILKL